MINKDSIHLLLTERKMGREGGPGQRDIKNGKFIGKREIFSEPVNREITLSGVGHTCTLAISRLYTRAKQTEISHTQSHTHTMQDDMDFSGEGCVQMQTLSS